MGGDMTRAPTIADFTGGTVIRIEMADGTARHIDGGQTKFRAMPGNITGADVDAYLYAATGLDPHRVVFDLASTMRGTGSTQSGSGTPRSGHREGFIFQRGANGKADGNPIGKVIFLTHDRRFAERDPSDRADFERLG